MVRALPTPACLLPLNTYARPEPAETSAAGRPSPHRCCLTRTAGGCRGRASWAAPGPRLVWSRRQPPPPHRPSQDLKLGGAWSWILRRAQHGDLAAGAQTHTCTAGPTNPHHQRFHTTTKRAGAAWSSEHPGLHPPEPLAEGCCPRVSRPGSEAHLPWHRQLVTCHLHCPLVPNLGQHPVPLSKERPVCDSALANVTQAEIAQ